MMTLEYTELAVAMDGFGDAWQDHQAVLLFLYGRKFYRDSTDQKRKDKIRNIVTSAAATAGVSGLQGKMETQISCWKRSAESSLTRKGNRSRRH